MGVRVWGSGKKKRKIMYTCQGVGCRKKFKSFTKMHAHMVKKHGGNDGKRR